MDETHLDPVAPTERIEILDVLRGLAIGGILIGNMQWFSGYGMMPAAIAAQAPQSDQIVNFLVHFMIEGKFYSVFSLLFGFGFALQIARAAERGDTNATLFKRRLFWLMLIGLMHAYLLWAGDILSIYALVGFLLILFRRKTDASLLKWAAALMIVPILTYLLMYALFVAFAPPGVAAQVEAGQSDFWTQAVASIREGSFFQIATGFNLQYIVGRYAGLIFEMRLPKILAMFLLGFYAYRRRLFQDLPGNKPFIRRVLIYGLGIGIPCNLAFAALAGREAVLPPTAIGIIGVFSYAIGVPALALGIIALIATLLQNSGWQRTLALLAPVGRMALTNYLLQTIVGVTIFYGYGFGLYGQVGPAKVTFLALAIFAVQIPLSALWLRYFAYGPMEWIWRQLTYRKRLPIRLTQKPTAI